MECTRHTVLFRKYRCASEHPSFYALTSLFPSISRYKRSSNTRAVKSDDSDDTTDPGPEDSRAVRKLTFIPSNAALPKAVVNFNGSQKELRSFTAALLVLLAHCLDPHHGDNKTYIDQFVLTCTLSMFAIHLRIRHRNLTRATSNPVDPTANSKRHFLLSARV